MVQEAEGGAAERPDLQLVNEGQRQQGTTHNREVTAEDVEELINRMLHGNAEQETMASADLQGRAQFVLRQTETAGSLHHEEDRVAHERATALARLQDTAEHNPLAPEGNNALAGSRPVTQLDLPGLIAKWHERASQLDYGETQRSRSQHWRQGQQSRYSKPARHRKSRIKERTTYQDINRAGTRDAAVTDQLGWELGELEGHLSGPMLRTRVPSPVTSVLVMRAVEEGTEEIHPKGQTVHQTARAVHESELAALVSKGHNNAVAADVSPVAESLDQGEILDAGQEFLEGTVRPSMLPSSSINRAESLHFMRI